MKNKLLMLAIAVCAFSQIVFSQTVSGQSAADSIVTVYTVADGKETPVGSGIIVGSDGFILTPLHLVKNAGQISVKLRNGEIFDNAVISNKDERRNVALLRIIASGLKVLPPRSNDETSIGTSISVVSNASGVASGTLSGMQLADGISGAGNGYRLFLFDAKSSDNLVGGVILDESGRPIAIVTGNPNVKQNIAVPLSTISGLMTIANPDSTAKIVPTEKPAEPKQVAKTEDVKPVKKGNRMTAREVLKSAQTIYVHSKTSFIQDPAFIAELMSNTDFNEWDWSFTNDRENADLILEVDRLPFVIKFTFKVYSIKHGVIIASGNKHTNDFNYGSPDLVREVIKRLKLEFALAK